MAAVYVGEVVHKRLRPRPHALSYGVFTLLLDLDRLDEIASGCRLFSVNRPNLIAFHERDHADGSADGEPRSRRLADVVREAMRNEGIETGDCRILALCYPRVLGYVFNPITTYFAVDAAGRVIATAYEVSNTFGERTTYVLAADAGPDGRLYQACQKRLYVSPFNEAHGRYTFHVEAPGERVVVGVLLRDGAGPLLKAHFAGDRRPLTDRVLLALLVRRPLMTLKVMAAIHWEALRLWLKGMKLVRRRPAAAGRCEAPRTDQPVLREPR
ncbi:MAG: DUF1365 family protein [Rhizobiales bacterium]|nr:DUF1365 family protein [Hyphomicrobiales bacterium]